MNLAALGPAPAAAPRWRRVLALGVLGATVALVIATLVGARRHELRLVLDLDPGWQAGLERLTIELEASGGRGRSLATVELRYGPSGPGPEKPEHVFRLPNGRYELQFTFHRRGESVPVRARRSLEVVGEARVSLGLP
jgi:hypothetical protein